MKPQLANKSYSQALSVRDSTGQMVSQEEMPPYAICMIQTLKQEMQNSRDEMKHELHTHNEEVMRVVSEACMKATRADELSMKTATEMHELRTLVTTQQHIIDEKEALLRLWQLQSELDKPLRTEKHNTVYVTPTPSNASKTPFSVQELDYSQADVLTKPNTRGGVEVKCGSREESDALLKEYPNVKNTQKPYRATYAKTPLMQSRDRLFSSIKQRLPRGLYGYFMKGQLYVTAADVSHAKKGEAPTDIYPAWLHVKAGPTGMDIRADPVNLEAVPNFAHQIVQGAEYNFKKMKGTNINTTPIRTLTDGGNEAEITDVEMADTVARGRRSPTGETPGAKKAAK